MSQPIIIITLCRNFIIDMDHILNIVFYASEVKETFGFSIGDHYNVSLISY